MVLSELQVATMGRVGCGAVSQVRSWEGGNRSDRCTIVTFGDIFCVSRWRVEVLRVRWRDREEDGGEVGNLMVYNSLPYKDSPPPQWRTSV